MFDDQQTNNSGSIPPNLPIGADAEDIFADTRIDQEPAPADTLAINTAPTAEEAIPTDATPTPVSALGVGVLTPKQPMNPTSFPPHSGTSAFQRPAYASKPPQYPSTGMHPLAEADANDSGIIKEPIGSKKIMLLIILSVVCIVVAVGGAWIYFAVIKESDSSDGFEPSTDTETDTPIAPPKTNNEKPTTQSTATSTETVDENIIFGDTIPDTDSDSLDDVREEEIGTNPLNWDTDEDQLSDGDEVIIWKTKPLDPDTDNDTFADGEEVKNGYNPLGSGKLFEPPSMATNTTKNTGGVGAKTTATGSAIGT